MSTVVVGASLAGVRTAEALRRRGYDQPITIVGLERELPYDRPQLSKGFLVDAAPELERLAAESAYVELGLELRLGVRATGLDLHEKRLFIEDGALRFENLVVATGAHPRPGPDRGGLTGFHVVRTLADAAALRADLEGSPRVAVIGGGFIGAEVAASARRRGLDVTVIERLTTPLAGNLGIEVGTLISQMHLDHGVGLRTGVSVTAARGHGRVEELLLSDGSEVACDVVVVGVGVEPTTAWLEGSGVLLDDGVLCDAELRARGAPHVFAVGDVARWPNAMLGESVRIEHWTNACEQADLVAAVITGTERPAPATPYVWSDQYGRRIQIVGRPRADDRIVVRPDPEHGKHAAAYERNGRLVGFMAIDLPKAVSKARRAIAAGTSNATDILESAR